MYSCTLFAQRNYAEIGKNYNSVQIYPKKSEVFTARNFKMLNDSVVNFTRISPYSKETLDISKINFISVKKGNHALSYGLIGAGIGFVFVVNGILKFNNSNLVYNLTEDEFIPVAIGGTLGFAAIGTLIGLSVPKWKNLFLPTNSTSFNFFIEPEIHSRYCGIHFACNF